MNYAARLARLEKLVGKGNCPECRLYRRHTWNDSKKPPPKPKDPSLLVAVCCEECGASSTCDLSEFPEELRELGRLYWTSRAEDTYTNPRAWAASQWVHCWVKAEDLRREVLREMRGLSEQAPPPHELRGEGHTRRERELEQARADDPDAKLYKKLLAQAQDLYERRRRRLVRRHGEYPFPELEARLDALQVPDYSGRYRGEPFEYDVSFSATSALDQEARAWTVCAELEKIILGEITSHTAGRLADCERRAREVIAASRTKYEEREERRRRDEAERERQRQRLERPAAP